MVMGWIIVLGMEMEWERKEKGRECWCVMGWYGNKVLEEEGVVLFFFYLVMVVMIMVVCDGYRSVCTMVATYSYDYSSKTNDVTRCRDTQRQCNATS